MIRKLLVANRGEIAMRVIRTCREMGIRTVAVYSDADAHALHVKSADEALHIGPAEASQSYLSIHQIIDAAKKSGAEAIHPGYGFLSERPELADACQDAGIVFVGPPASAMRALGDKISAKKLAVKAGVPIVPGFFEPDASPATLAREAEKIGYPVMLKASAGGGGRGMRALKSSAEFTAALAVASDEALKAFGNGAMMVEKLIECPRHIEVQVLADRHGNVATLFERECSIQRRNQKLIEEAPSPFLIKYPEIWPEMSKAACSIVQAAGYENAGTVEFIVDPKTGEFFFLEVNARLQVEHPVTEAITGLDLVRLQIRVADGDRLDIDESLLNGVRAKISGHAIEARIIAEDPERNFLPSIGKILAWAEPLESRIRLDAGFSKDDEIPRFYDSLIAKLIVHGGAREEAIARLRSALLDFHVLGINTNIGYLIDVIEHPDFQAGVFDTAFLGREFSNWRPCEAPAELGAIAALASVSNRPRSARSTSFQTPAWDVADSFRLK